MIVAACWSHGRCSGRARNSRRGSRSIRSSTAIILFYAALFAPLARAGLMLGRIERLTDAARSGAGGALGGDRPGGRGRRARGIAAGYVWLNGTMVPAAPTAMQLAAGSRLIPRLGLAITVLQVGAEEMLFRGWLLRSLQDRAGPAAAVVLSALAFSAFHLLGGAASRSAWST